MRILITSPAPCRPDRKQRLPVWASFLTCGYFVKLPDGVSVKRTRYRLEYRSCPLVQGCESTPLPSATHLTKFLLRLFCRVLVSSGPTQGLPPTPLSYAIWHRCWGKLRVSAQSIGCRGQTWYRKCEAALEVWCRPTTPNSVPRHRKRSGRGAQSGLRAPFCRSAELGRLKWPIESTHRCMGKADRSRGRQLSPPLDRVT